MLQFDGKNVMIPASLLGKTIVSKDIGALLRLTQMLEPDNWHSFETKLLSRFNPAFFLVSPLYTVLADSADRSATSSLAEPMPAWAPGPGDNHVLLVNQNRWQRWIVKPELVDAGSDLS